MAQYVRGNPIGWNTRPKREFPKAPEKVLARHALPPASNEYVERSLPMIPEEDVTALLQIAVQGLERGSLLMSIAGGTAQILRTVIAGRLLDRRLPQTRDGYLKN